MLYLIYYFLYIKRSREETTKLTCSDYRQSISCQQIHIARQPEKCRDNHQTTRIHKGLELRAPTRPRFRVLTITTGSHSILRVRVSRRMPMEEGARLA